MSDHEYPTELARQRHEMEMLWSEVEALRDEVRTLRHTLSKEKSRFREELCEPHQRALHTIAGVVCEYYRIRSAARASSRISQFSFSSLAA